MATGQVSPKRGKVVDIPANAPTIGTATANPNGSISVPFTAGSQTVGGPVFNYTVVSTPGFFTATASTSPISVSGLTVGTSYTFKVKGNNPTGSGPESAASNAVTSAVQTQAIDYLIVAGGGGGGAGSQSFSGGGGAGGVRCTVGATGGGGSLESQVNLIYGTSYTVVVGGGAGFNGNGSDSYISGTGVSVTSTGGGAGAAAGYPSNGSPQVGGSGGGGAANQSPRTGAAGTAGQGYAGGTGGTSGTYGGSGGGGGGAGQVGAVGRNDGSGGANGGNGIQTSISGTATYYGGGGASRNNGNPSGIGGLGGGGQASTAGGTNTGGGGYSDFVGTAGSGIVIIRYPDSAPAATSTTGSPTITVTGGYRIYKFTGSGSITI